MEKKLIGINIVMSEAVASSINDEMTISNFQYLAEMNIVTENNGNGVGTISITRSGQNCQLDFGKWAVFPSVEFSFDWSGQSYKYRARCGEEEIIEIWVKNPSGASIFKRTEYTDVYDIQAIFNDFVRLKTFSSSEHFNVAKVIQEFDGIISKYCKPYTNKIDINNYKKLLELLEDLKGQVLAFTDSDVIDSASAKDIISRMNMVEEKWNNLAPLSPGMDTIKSKLKSLIES